MGLEVGEGGMEEEEEKEKIPLCRSIGHRPLRGRCPAPLQLEHHLLRQGTGTADHLTFLRLFTPFPLRLAAHICRTLALACRVAMLLCYTVSAPLITRDWKG